MLTSAEQLSLALGCAGPGMSLQATVWSSGTPVSTGATLSTTVMVCTCSIPLPQSSVALQVRVSV